MKKNLLIVLLILLVSLQAKEINTLKYEDAYEFYKKGDFTTAMKMFKKLAKVDNDSDAAYILGYMYENAEGTKIDNIASAKWYKISAKGYYHDAKRDPTRDVNKAHRKIYETLDQIQNKQTQDTIKEKIESLYNIKAYKANYFLPISARYDGHYKDTYGQKAQDIETEFQVSIRYDFASDTFGLNEIYTISYTQLAFWQLYETSAFFRETNYNPEFFVTIPTSTLTSIKSFKALKVGLAHQSNGRGSTQERSWNYLNGSFYFQHENIFTELMLWYRLPDNINYNPQLIDYMGHGHVKFTVPYKKHIFELLLRSNFEDTSALKASYSYPAFGRDDLFLYMNFFSGYGESLVDYNHNVNKIGLGFSISR